MVVPWRQIASSSVKVTIHNIELRISFSESTLFTNDKYNENTETPENTEEIVKSCMEKSIHSSMMLSDRNVPKEEMEEDSQDVHFFVFFLKIRMLLEFNL